MGLLIRSGSGMGRGIACPGCIVFAPLHQSNGNAARAAQAPAGISGDRRITAYRKLSVVHRLTIADRTDIKAINPRF